MLSVRRDFLTAVFSKRRLCLAASQSANNGALIN